MNFLQKNSKANKVLLGLTFLLVLVLLIAGWKFRWAPLNFYFFELAPPDTTSLHISYIPRIVFYDKSGKPIEQKETLPGGSLEDFSKILLLLSFKSDNADSVPVRVISSRTFISGAAIPYPLPVAPLGQEFVLAPGREITVDIMNFNPVYIKELSELNPNKKIPISIFVRFELTGQKLQKEVELVCTNQANIVSSSYNNNDLRIFYPSCLLKAVR